MDHSMSSLHLVCTFPSLDGFCGEIRTSGLASLPLLASSYSGQVLLNPLRAPRGDLISCLRAQFGRVGWFISQPLALRLAQELVSLSALTSPHSRLLWPDTVILELLVSICARMTETSRGAPMLLSQREHSRLLCSQLYVCRLHICIALYCCKLIDHITFRFLCSALTLVLLKSCSRNPEGPA